MLKNIFTAGARSFRRDSPRFLCVSLRYLSTSAVKIFFLVHYQFFILLLFIVLFSACRSPGRLGNVRGKILAKTGSITYAASLAGYAKNERETLGFVILCNNEIRKADSSVLIDAIAATLMQ